MSVTIDKIQVEIQSSSSNAAAGIKDLTAALGELKKNGTITTTIKNLKSLSDVLNSFSSASNAVNKISSLSASLAKLKSVGSLTTLVNSVKTLPTALNSLSQIGDVSGVAGKLQSLSTALAPLGNVKASGLTSAVNSLSKISDVTKALDDNTISEFTDKVKKLSDALGPLSQKLTTVKSGLSGFSKAADESGKEAKELGLNVGAINFDALTNNISTVINFLSQLATKMKTVIDQAIQWEGIAARFGRGFGEQAEETYAWIKRLNEEMDINIQAFMQQSSIYATMLTGFGVANKDATKMALGYMELTYDIWAGYNDVYKTFEEAAEAVRSAIAGEVEPIRRAGFTIVEATLEVTAANYGITKSIATMTEAEKSYLRYLTLVDQAYSQNLVGTYAKELNTAEGLMRTASQQLKSLAQAFGSLFLPILVRVMPYVQAFIKLLTELVHITAGLFGIEIQKVDWSGYNEGSSAIGGVQDSADGAAGSLKNATKAAKDLKNATLGMDELNVISPNTGSAGGGSGAGGTGVDGAFAGIDIDSLWDESIFKGLNKQVDDIVKKMRDWLGITDEIDTWAEIMDTRLGTILKTLGGIVVVTTTIKSIIGIAKLVKGIETIATAVKKVVGVVKGSKIITGLTKLLKGFKSSGGLAKFAASLGKVAKVALPIAAIIIGITSAVFGIKDAVKEGIDWLSSLEIALGTTLAGAGIGFLIGGPAGALIGGLIGLVAGALTDITILIVQKWDEIKAFFGKIGDWFKEDFAGFFVDAWDSITNIDWNQVAYDIGHALGSVWKNITEWNIWKAEWWNDQWDKIWTNGIASWNIWKASWWNELWDKVWTNGIAAWDIWTKEWWQEAGRIIWTDGIASWNIWKASWWKNLWDKVWTNGIVTWNIWKPEWWKQKGKDILDGLMSGLADITRKIREFCDNFVQGFKDALGIHSPSTVARDEIGKNILLGIVEALKPTGLINAFTTMWNNVKTVFSNVPTWFWNNVISPIRNTFSEAWDYIENKVADMWASIKNIFSGVGTWFWNNVISPIRNAFSEAWTFIKNSAGTSWENVKSAFGNGGDFIKNILISAWDTAKTWWNNNVKLSIPSLSFKVTYDTKGLSKTKQAIVNVLGLQGWPKLSFAANGGMFEQGSMIWAGERGAEIVANASGGKTGVMNVQQMYQAVYDATYSAMVATRQSQPQQSGGSYNLYIDGKQVTTSVERTQKNRGTTIFGTEVYSL